MEDQQTLLINIVEELGKYEIIDSKKVFVKGDECLGAIGELFRQLKRDDEYERDIFITMGGFNIISNKLIPLSLFYSDDNNLIRNILKVMVKLTLPLNPDSQHLKRQREILWDFKESFINSEFIALLLSLLGGPISRLFSQEYSSHSAEAKKDTEMVEFILSLIRNIVRIPDPESSSITSMSLKDKQLFLQEEFIIILHKEKFLELFLTLAQTMKENKLFSSNPLFSLLLLEIFSEILGREDPHSVWANSDIERETLNNSSNNNNNSKSISNIDKENDPLFKMKQKENQLKKLSKANRGTSSASRFRGTFSQISGATGSSTSKDFKIYNNALPSADGANEVRKLGVNQSTIGGNINSGFSKSVDGNTTLTYGKKKGQSIKPRSQSSQYLLKILREWATQFLDGCYNVLMENVVYEFAQTNSSILESDRLNFLSFTYFFTTFALDMLQSSNSYKISNTLLNADGLAAAAASLSGDDATADYSFDTIVLGCVASTLSVPTFNFIFSCIELYMGTSNMRKTDYAPLESAVSTLRSMVSILYYMSASEQKNVVNMSRKMQSSIYFNREVFLSGVIKLTRRYDPRHHSNHMLVDITELTYTTIHMIERFCRLQDSTEITVKKRHTRKRETTKSDDIEHLDGNTETINEDDDKVKEKKEDGDEDDNGVDKEELEDMEDEEKEREEELATKSMSLDSYISDFAHPDIINNFCNLLGKWYTNSTNTNFQVVSLLKKIVNLGFEPSFYRLSIFYMFNSFINDPIIARDYKATDLLELINKVLESFFIKAESNNILYLRLLTPKPINSVISINLEHDDKDNGDALKSNDTSDREYSENEINDNDNNRDNVDDGSSSKKNKKKEKKVQEDSDDGENYLKSDEDDDKIKRFRDLDEEDREAKSQFSSDEELVSGDRVVTLQETANEKSIIKYAKIIGKKSNADAIFMWIKDNLLSAISLREREAGRLAGKFTLHIFKTSIVQKEYKKSKTIKKLFKLFKFNQPTGSKPNDEFTIPESKLYNHSYLNYLHKLIEKVESIIEEKNKEKEKEKSTNDNQEEEEEQEDELEQKKDVKVEEEKEEEEEEEEVDVEDREDVKVKEVKKVKKDRKNKESSEDESDKMDIDEKEEDESEEEVPKKRKVEITSKSAKKKKVVEDKKKKKVTKEDSEEDEDEEEEKEVKNKKNNNKKLKEKPVKSNSKNKNKKKDNSEDEEEEEENNNRVVRSIIKKGKKTQIVIIKKKIESSEDEKEESDRQRDSDEESEEEEKKVKNHKKNVNNNNNKKKSKKDNQSDDEDEDEEEEEDKSVLVKRKSGETNHSIKRLDTKRLKQAVEASKTSRERQEQDMEKEPTQQAESISY